jgi:hypothetical protein
LVGCAALVFFVVEAVLAGPVSLPHTFQSGTPAVAEEVNANFAALRSGINDNDARIAANTALMSTYGARIAALEAAQSDLKIVAGVVDIDGNVVSGTGFTASRAGSYYYDVAFDEPFTEVPAVVVTPLLKRVPETRVASQIGDNRTDEIKDGIEVTHSDGTYLMQSGFFFVAVGR